MSSYIDILVGLVNLLLLHITKYIVIYTHTSSFQQTRDTIKDRLNGLLYHYAAPSVCVPMHKFVKIDNS